MRKTGQRVSHARKEEREKKTQSQPDLLLSWIVFSPTDSREESILGSIPLPSYTIAPVGPEDHISRKYAFKVRSHFNNEQHT